MKTVMVLVGVFLLVFSENLLACHQLVPFESGGLKGHSSAKTRGYGGITLGSTASTTDSTATTTNCDWRTAKIEKFFNDSYQQIAEESAQGSGQHLEALAALTGCSAEQYGTFETEAISDRSDSNSSMICLVPVIGIVKTFCDSWQCREPWPARCPDRRWWPRH